MNIKIKVIIEENNCLKSKYDHQWTIEPLPTYRPDIVLNRVLVRVGEYMDI